MSDPTQARIDGLVKENKVLLFMKGTPQFPQCGFSATCIGILDGIGAKYNTVNVLADPAIRDGVKAYSNWPTIPQLYVEGEFLGGCDIMKQLYASGELAQTLASYIAPVTAPKLTVTPAAAETLAAAIKDAGPGQVLHLTCGATFQYDLSIGDARPADFTCESNGVTVHIDRASAPRLDGGTIDFVNDARGGGFQITSPHEPPKVRAMSVTELDEKLKKGEPLQLWDVRPDAERKVAKIDAAKQLDEQAWKIVEALPKDTMLVIHCHHGGRSQRAAEQLVKSGFTKVYNLTGGIDAWSTQVDSKVAKY
ncbi:MAG: Grx4 family monothiol glutaredoxin [Polyangia bacterium]